MPFVQARCVNCNGTLKVDSAQRAAICPYCGTPYVVEDAINHYHNHIEHLHADVVNMVDERSSEMRLKAAETFMKQRRYGSAKQTFADVCNISPQNYLGWWGQIRAITQEFTLKPERLPQLNELKELFDSAFVVASPTQKKELQEKYNTYYLPLRQKTEKEYAALKKKNKEYISRIEETKAECERNLPILGRRIAGLPNWIFSILSVVFAVGIVRIFVKDAPVFSPLVVLPVVVFLADKIICFVRKQIYNSQNRKKERKHAKLRQEESRLYLENSRVVARIRELESL